MKITAGRVIGAIIALALGGPGALVIFILGYVVFECYMAKRERLFIRSYVYLTTLWEHNDTVEANLIANGLDPKWTHLYAQRALECAQKHSGGSMPSLIQEAKDQGFVYNLWGQK